VISRPVGQVKMIMRKFIGPAIVVAVLLMAREVYVSRIGEVSLKEVGTLAVIPPSNKAGAAWQSARGDEASGEIESIRSWLDLIDKEPHKIRIERMKFDPKKYYYFGVGCKIESIKYFKSIHNSRWYHVDSVKRSQIKPCNEIYVYEGDVPVADIKP
jgi:hypothetical protein